MSEINPVTKDQLFEKKIAENTGSDYNVGDISNVVPVTKDQALLKEIAANTAGQSGDITELETKVSATQDMVSDAYDSTHTYDVGDYCIYENAMYKCNTASTTGTWDSSKWDAVTVADELGELTERVTITRKEWLPLVGVTSSDLYDRNFYITDGKTFIEIHFSIDLNNVAVSADQPILDLPSIAHNKSIQYGFAINTSDTSVRAVFNYSNKVIIADKAITATGANYLVGMFRMSLI